MISEEPFLKQKFDECAKIFLGFVCCFYHCILRYLCYMCPDGCSLIPSEFSEKSYIEDLQGAMFAAKDEERVIGGGLESKLLCMILSYALVLIL